MEVDAQLRGFETVIWNQIAQELSAADFAQKITVRFVDSSESLHFWFVRNDGRHSRPCAMGLRQFNDIDIADFKAILRDVAETYLRGYADPLIPEKQKALGKLLFETWEEWGEIVFGVLPADQTEMHIMEIIDFLSRHLQGSIEDTEIADYLKFASLNDIRQTVTFCFPEDVYPVIRP